MESDGSTLEDFSQEDWCNQVLDSAFQEGDMETGESCERAAVRLQKVTHEWELMFVFVLPAEEIQVPKSRALQIQAELSEQTQ